VIVSNAIEKIRLEDVSKSFTARHRTVQALQPTSLQVANREFVAVVGPSGCGKSTILNMIAGLSAPSSGRVLYDGQPVTQVNRRVGYLTQKDTLLPWRSVADNIGIALELACNHVSVSERNDRVARMVDLVGLRGFEHHYPGELSGGMRKRAALARTLIYGPETLLMDEPFGALDAQLKLVMHDELLRLTEHHAMTVVFVTHDLAEAIALADRIVVFGGRPGHIKTVRQVDIPYPRDVFRVRFTSGFSRLYEDLWEELKGEVKEAERV
jgi:NitT/TauT family transport system ATP-binding protein